MAGVSKKFYYSKVKDGKNEEGAIGGVKTEKMTSKSFETLGEVSSDHLFAKTVFKPVDKCVFNCAVLSEMKMMEKDLPDGIYVKFYENRLDLCSAMIEGPKGTPYEGCLFFFDVQLSADYPNSPPVVKYISYSKETLNPNLYAEGYVCLSLLGTWPGSPEEMWSPKKSTLLQLFVSIQGLILVSEPLYNEPGNHGLNGHKTPDSEKYNEDVVRLVLETMARQIRRPPNCFRDVVLDHYSLRGLDVYKKFETFLVSPSTAPFPLAESRNRNAFERLLKEFKEAVVNLCAVPATPKAIN